MSYAQADRLVLIPDIASSLLSGLLTAFGAYLLFKYCMSSRSLLFSKVSTYLTSQGKCKLAMLRRRTYILLVASDAPSECAECEKLNLMEYSRLRSSHSSDGSLGGRRRRYCFM